MSRKKCIFVLGMHRSGTSALTGMLNKLGLSIGEDVISPAYDNPKGFFENKRVIAVNNQILSAWNMDWMTALSPPNISLKEAELEQLKASIKDILLEEFSEKEVLLIKDPRLCLVLPIWQEVFKSLDIATQYIIITRNPIEISLSLEKRNGIAVFQSFMLWLNYLLQAELWTRTTERTFVNYEDILTQPVQILRQIAEQLNLFSSTDIDNKAAIINDFIVSDLKHHHSTIASFEHLNVPTYFNEFYELTHGLSKGKYSFINIQAKIDKIREQHYKYVTSFESIMNEVVPQFQIFFDTGNGFNEIETIKSAIHSTGKRSFKFEIASYKNLKTIRIDPLDGPCILKNLKIELIATDGTKQDFTNYKTNVYYKKEGKLFFDTADPQLIIEINGANRKKMVGLVIEVHYCALNLEALAIINHENKEIIEKLSDLMLTADHNNKVFINEPEEGNNEQLVSEYPTNNIEQENEEELQISTQLFYDLGSKFNEENSIIQGVNTNTKKIVFNLEIEENSTLQKLRFDPAIRPVLVKINQFSAVDKDGNSELLHIEEYNGIHLSEGRYIFLTFDPIFILSKPVLIPEKIYVELEYHQIKQNDINDLGRQFQAFEIIKKVDLQAIQQKSVLLLEKEQEIEEFTKLVEKSHQRIKEKELQLTELNKNINDFSLLLKQKNTYISAVKSETETHQKILAEQLKTIRSLEEMLAINQTLFGENEKQTERLHASLNQLQFRIQEKETHLKKQLTEYEAVVRLKEQLEIKNHELINLLEMEQIKNEKAKQTIESLKQERQTIHEDIKANQLRLNDLNNQVKTMNNNLELHQASIDKLVDIIHQKDEIILRQNEELSRQKEKAEKRSIGALIWNFITWPFRFIYRLFVNPKGKISLFLGFLAFSISKPIALLKNINRRNINTLLIALKEESPATIFRNFKRLLSKPKLVKQPIKQTVEVVKSTSSPITKSKMVRQKAAAGQMLMYIDFSRYKRDNLLKIAGWGVARKGVQSVEIWSKNHKIGEAHIGIERSDVHTAFPEYQDSLYAGFVYEEKTEETLEQVEVRVIGKDDTYIELPVEIAPCTLPTILQQAKNSPYEVWMKNNTITGAIRKQLTIQQSQFSYRPLISIVIPVYNVEEQWLEKAINSLRNQIYDNWEICMADDASPKPHVVPYLKKAEQSDARIKVAYRKENGNISAATNSALAIASGDFIAFMDNDDELSEHALYEIVAALNENKSIDVLYSDEDKITEEGQRYEPFFKPDWSPELLLSYNYFNHLLCVRKSICDKVEGLRSVFDGAQDYDFILRVMEHAKVVHHIPKILYHWRAVEGSIAAEGSAKAESFHFFDKCTDALQAYLDRNELKAKAYQPTFAKERGLGLNHLKWSHKGPLVSIIIPSRNHYATLKKCITSLHKTTYRSYEIIIADNASDDRKTLQYLRKLKKKANIQVLTIPNPGNRFSYAYINNQAVKKAKGKYILLLNDDVEVIHPGWLSQMVGYASIDGVGVVGAKLLYPDETVQHAGVLNGLYPHGYDNLPDHTFKHNSKDSLGYFFFNQVARNYSAVTAACLLMPRKLFTSLGGLDEENFALAYNDVDLCLRVMEQNQRVVFAPNALLYHYESKSRKNVLYIEEVATFKKKWRKYQEPYYNPNFSKVQPFKVSPFSTLAYPEPEEKILIVTHNLNFEGAPIQMLEIVEGMLAKNPTLTIEICSPQDGPLKASYEALGLPVHLFEDPVTQAIQGITPYEEGLNKFSNWIKKGAFTSVYANTLVTFFVHEACHVIGVKSVWGIHESSSPEAFFTYLPAQIQAKAYDSFYYPYALVFVAKATQRIFEDFDVNHSSIVINNGLRTERFQHIGQKQTLQKGIKKELGLKEDDILYLNLGTVCARKGQLDFVTAAVESIKNGMHNARFLLVGARDRGLTGAYLADIRKIIADNKLEEYFIIIDETSEVEQYYLAADVFVCSSYNESYPRVLLEAMLFELPIITTPIFGIVEQVIENINALFYQPGDAGKLAQHIFELSSNEEKRKTFEKNAPFVYQLINSYEEMIDKYRAIM